jgi:ABC-type transporter MlaC component
LAALLVVMTPVARAEAPPAPDAPTQFVDAALHDTVSALGTPSNAVPTRSERLHAVLTRYFDVAQVGRNSVGAAWVLVPPAEQADFLATFENFLMASYVGSLAGADALTFGPARVIALPGDAFPPASDAAARVVVRVDVHRADAPAHAVLIALRRAGDGSYSIVDVSAEAISLGRLLAADFGAFLHRNGGRLEALATALRDKIAARAAER